jgi:hypothetical protein
MVDRPLFIPVAYTILSHTQWNINIQKAVSRCVKHNGTSKQQYFAVSCAMQ